MDGRNIAAWMTGILLLVSGSIAHAQVADADVVDADAESAVVSSNGEPAFEKAPVAWPRGDLESIRVRPAAVMVSVGGGQNARRYPHYYSRRYATRSFSGHVRATLGAEPLWRRGWAVVVEGGAVREEHTGDGRCLDIDCGPSERLEWSLMTIGARAGYHGYAGGIEVGAMRFEQRDPAGTVEDNWVTLPSARFWVGPPAFHFWLDTGTPTPDAAIPIPLGAGFSHQNSLVRARVGVVLAGLMIDVDVPVKQYGRVGIEARAFTPSGNAVQLRWTLPIGRATRLDPLPDSSL